MKELLQRVFRIGKNAEQIGYEESKRLLQSTDPADRRRVASNTEVKPEVLYFLATDPDATVRVAVAANEATPAQADLILAGDNNEAVRADLARKIGRFAPGLSPRETDRLRRMTYEVLELLIGDQAVRVRRVMADALKDMPDAPVELVQRLARDVELSVSGPVLQYSPVLSDADLLDILSQLPIPGAASAIARRNGLSSVMADAIGTGNDIDAVTALLSNGSAQIREDTLDHIVERAPANLAWHRPLVDRPRLSDETARKLALFVANDLIGRLRARTDLKPETVRELQRTVLSRLEAETPPEPPAPAAAKPANEPSKDLAEARRLHAAKKLNEDAMVDALIAGRLGLLNAGLSLLAQTPLPVVDKIMGAHSAKGLIALSWKAGLPMRFAVRLQTVVGRIPTAQIMKPRPDGGYPLPNEAMEWQLGFFADMIKG